MITEAILSFFFGLAGFVVGLFPDSDPPSWLSNGASKLAEVTGYASGLGAWIPFTLAGTVLGALLVCLGIGFTIKVVRMVVSIVTGGGGSAA